MFLYQARPSANPGFQSLPAEYNSSTQGRLPEERLLLHLQVSELLPNLLHLDRRQHRLYPNIQHGFSMRTWHEGYFESVFLVYFHRLRYSLQPQNKCTSRCTCRGPRRRSRSTLLQRWFSKAFRREESQATYLGHGNQLWMWHWWPVTYHLEPGAKHKELEAYPQWLLCIVPSKLERWMVSHCSEKWILRNCASI